MREQPRFGELAIIGARLCEPLTGVGRYFECLLREWSGAATPFERITVLTPGDPQLEGAALHDPVRIEIVPRGFSPLYWENVQLARRLRRADLLFGAYTLPWFEAKRGVVANLGIYEGRWARGFSMAARLKTRPLYVHSARAALRVIANSESTKADIVEHFGVDAAQVDAIPLGADAALAPAPPQEAGLLPREVRRRYGLPDGPYLLMVGKLSERRNVPLLIEAFAAAKRDGELPHSLLIVGPDYLGLAPLDLARRQGVEGKVAHAAHAPMRDLAELYRHAAAYVLPTEHEGFSLTIPEAMASGAPVLTFDHPALEGCLREAAWVVRPPSAAALAAALRTVAGDAARRRALRDASIACAQKFTWASTAARTMQVLAAAAARLAAQSR